VAGPNRQQTHCGARRVGCGDGASLRERRASAGAHARAGRGGVDRRAYVDVVIDAARTARSPARRGVGSAAKRIESSSRSDLRRGSSTRSCASSCCVTECKCPMRRRIGLRSPSSASAARRRRSRSRTAPPAKSFRSILVGWGIWSRTRSASDDAFERGSFTAVFSRHRFVWPCFQAQLRRGSAPPSLPQWRRCPDLFAQALAVHGARLHRVHSALFAVLARHRSACERAVRAPVLSPHRSGGTMKRPKTRRPRAAHSALLSQVFPDAISPPSAGANTPIADQVRAGLRHGHVECGNRDRHRHDYFAVPGHRTDVVGDAAGESAAVQVQPQRGARLR
jgi:hypothetical protein